MLETIVNSYMNIIFTIQKIIEAFFKKITI